MAKLAYDIEAITGRLLIWAHTARQAMVVAKKFNKVGTVKRVGVNYHASNMFPKCKDWADYIARGGS